MSLIGWVQACICSTRLTKDPTVQLAQQGEISLYSLQNKIWKLLDRSTILPKFIYGKEGNLAGQTQVLPVRVRGPALILKTDYITLLSHYGVLIGGSSSVIYSVLVTATCISCFVGLHYSGSRLFEVLQPCLCRLEVSITGLLDTWSLRPSALVSWKCCSFKILPVDCLLEFSWSEISLQVKWIYWWHPFLPI